MSYLLIESNPLSLESPSESNDDEDIDDEDISDEDLVSESQSDGSKEYDDDDFDNNSLEIDEEERHKISAQINPDEDEEDEETEEEEKEEIIEKEDSEQEKNQNEHDDQATVAAHSSGPTPSDSGDDDHQPGKVTTVGQDDGETSMTESAEYRTMDTYGLIQKLESERKQLLQDHELDEQIHQYFYNKLKLITQKMEHLQQIENHSMQTDIARRQLEMEAYRVQEAMQEKLGLQEESKLKREARVERIRCIEVEIKSLQIHAKKAFQSKLEQEDRLNGLIPKRMEAINGKTASLHAQTGDATSSKIPDGVAPGMPLTSNHLMTSNGSWSSWRGHSGLFSASQELTSTSFNSTTSNCSLGEKPGNCHSSTLSLGSDSGEHSPLLGTKVEMVYSLLSMLGTHNKDDISRTLLAMSQSQDNCIAMRQAGCLPLLLQLLHGSDKDSGLLGKTRGSKTARARAAAALHNIVHCHHDDKRGRREARTLRLLEQIRAHCDQQREDSDDEDQEPADSSKVCTEMDHHPGAAIAALMKLSFDEDYRHAICTLGGLQAIAELLEIDNKTVMPMNDYSTTIRRYSCMALTNLTFGDGKNKALLCSIRGAMEALTDQLRSTNEDLIQAAASVLRNLSWRADLASKKTLREIGVVTTLMIAAMTVKKETTLKSILSALWNLSSHCSENKAEICAVEGALQFLVSLLTYKSAAKTLAIIENGGGILRNVSSQIAIREDYRQTLRKLDCLKILLFHLKSPSLTIVSNACGTLWNLSARCEEDQNALRDMGAVSMLRNLVHSRHKMISSGSSAALKNLLSSVPAGKSLDGDRSTDSSNPSLHVRKLRALEAELDHNLSETCENVDSPRNSPTEIIHRSESEPRRFVYHLNGVGGSSGGYRQEEDTRKHMTRRQLMPRNGIENVNNFETNSSGHVARAGSQDSVGSTHSDISHDRVRSHAMLAKSSILLHRRQCSSLDRKVQHPDSHISKIEPSHPCNDIKTHTDKYSMGNNGISIVSDVSASVSQPISGTINHHRTLVSQAMPAIPWTPHKGEDQPGILHGQSSLTQSAPSHCQAFHNHNMTNNQNQQSLLERLAKSSSGLSGSCNLNNSITLANSSLNSSLDFSSHLPQPSTVDILAEQPANYCLKYQDEANGDRNYKSSSGSNPNFRSGTNAEHSKSSVINENNYPKNNKTLDETVPVNNRHTSVVSGSNRVSNPVSVSPHRPVPNLVHNQFHTPQGCQYSGVPTHQSPFISSHSPYISNNDLPLGGHGSSCHTIQASSQSLPSQTAACKSGFTSQGKIYNPTTSHFNTSVAAHQNFPHMYQVHDPGDDPEVELNSSTDLSLPRAEISRHNNRKYVQGEPSNYSVHVHVNESNVNQEYETCEDKGICFEVKTTNGTVDQTGNFSEGEEAAGCFSSVSSLSSQQSCEANENNSQLRVKHLSEKVELVCIKADEAPRTSLATNLQVKGTASTAEAGSGFRKMNAENGFKDSGTLKMIMSDELDQIKGELLTDRSSSSDSLSSCDNHLAHNSAFSIQSKKGILDEELDLSSESLPSSPEESSCLINSVKDLLSTLKPRNVVTKQSLNFDRMFNPIKPESFVSFATFDEENKPINFTTKSQELSLMPSFPRPHAGKAVDSFSSFGVEPEPPPLTFSTFQKNFHAPAVVHNSHATSRLCSLRAKTMPTLPEQASEAEFSSSVVSDVPLAYSEEIVQPGPKYQNGMLINNPIRKDDFNKPQLQHQTNKTEERESELVKLPKCETYTGSFEVNDKWRSPKTGKYEHEVADFPNNSSPPNNISSDQIIQSSTNAVMKKKSGIPLKMSKGLEPNVVEKASSLSRMSSTQVFSSTAGAQFSSAKSTNPLYDDSKDHIGQMLEPGSSRYQYGRGCTSSDDNRSSMSDDSSSEYNESDDYKASHPLSVTTFHNISSTEVIRMCPIEGLKSVSVARQGLDQLTTAGMCLTAEQDTGNQRHHVKADAYPNLNSNSKQVTNHVLQTSKVEAHMPTDSKDSSNSTINHTMEALNTNNTPLHVSDDENEDEDEEMANLFSRNDSVISVHGQKDIKNQASVVNVFCHKEQIIKFLNKDAVSSILQEQQGLQSQSSDSSSAEDDERDGQNKCDTGDTSDYLSRNSSSNSLSDVCRTERSESSLNNYNTIAKYCSSSSNPYHNVVVHYDVVTPGQTPTHKSRLPRAHERVNRQERIKPYENAREEVRNGHTSSGLIKSASLEMTYDYLTSTEEGQGSLSDLSHDQSSSENLMTNSCSNTTDFDLNFQTSSFLSQRARCLKWCHQRQQYQIDEESVDYDEVLNAFTEDISPEETEKLLTENVNLIMSVIQTTKMSGSSVDEDLFIENETISLVSNDYTSDTNSEVSVTWSAKSNKTSHLSAALLDRKQNQVPSSEGRTGPRFVKPETTRSSLQKVSSENVVKSIRGRRKPLYPGKTQNAAAAVRGNVKTIVPNRNRAMSGPANNKTVVTNAAGKPDVGRLMSAVKKTSPKNFNVQAFSRPVSNEISKSTSQAQRFVLRRSRSAGPATTPGKNRTSPPAVTSTNKVGPRNTVSAQPQTNQANSLRNATKVGRLAGSKSSIPSSTNIPSPGTKTTTDQSRLSTGSNVSPGHSKSSPGNSTTSNQSKLPNASLNNKNTNNLANTKTNNKLGGQATRSPSNNALNSSTAEKKGVQNTSKVPSGSPPNTAVNIRSRDSGIPRRKSSGSSCSLSNADSNKSSTPGNMSSNKRISPVIADSRKCTSPPATEAGKNQYGISDSNKHNLSGNVNANKHISSNGTDLNKRTSPNSTDSSKRTSPSSSDSSKRTSPNSSDSSKRTSPNSSDSSKRTSPNSSDSSKRTSPKSTLINAELNKISPPTNAERNKLVSAGNTDPNKTTPTGNVGRKQSSSRIATLQKKGGSHEKSPTRGRQLSSTSSTSSSSKLPVTKIKSAATNIKPSNFTPPGFKTKAATLPNSNLSSSKSRTFSERISKSSTYEKISSELLDRESKVTVRSVQAAKKISVSNISSHRKADNFDSSESDVKQREEFDSSDNDDNESNNIKINKITNSGVIAQTNSLETSNDSLENVFRDSDHHAHPKGSLSSSSNMDSLGQNEDAGLHIDSRTFRKKKRDTSISDLDLPNADETCRSTSSINDSFVIPHINNISVTSYKSSFNFDTFLKDMNIIDILESDMNNSNEKANRLDDERSGGKTKSTVAQGLKKLFSSRHKDKEKETKEKHTVKESNKSKHHEKESKSKHHKSNGREKKSGRDKREYDFFRSNIKIEPSTTWSLEDSLVDDLESNSVLPIRQMSFRTETYNSANTAANLNSTAVENSYNQSAPGTKNDQQQFEIFEDDFPSADRHLTKTEMLLARRRRTNLLSSHSDDGSGDGEIRSLHAITAV
ncbi:hypothetical protein BsWGS_17147 [Bradybaena similaris]